MKPLITRASNHRIGQPAQIAQLRSGNLAQRGDVGQYPWIQRTHRVDLEEVQARGAQVNPADRPVGEAGDAQRATVAHALRQDPPGVQRMALVLPGRPEDLEVMIRLGLAEAVRDRADPQAWLRPAAASQTAVWLLDRREVGHRRASLLRRPRHPRSTSALQSSHARKSCRPGCPAARIGRSLRQRRRQVHGGG